MKNSIAFAILRWLKERVDKLYYSKYTLGQRETLIRTMFPWIQEIGEYKKLNEFFLQTSSTEISGICHVMMSFYWGEVNALTTKWKFNDIQRYQGIVDFCQALQDYSSEVSKLNTNSQ